MAAEPNSDDLTNGSVPRVAESESEIYGVTAEEATSADVVSLTGARSEPVEEASDRLVQ